MKIERSASIREKLRNTPYAEAPIIPTSIVSGRGLNELKFARGSGPPKHCHPATSVNRVCPLTGFSASGIGTVVTGTLTGGTLRRGQSVCVQPSGNAARIRNIQSHNRNVESSGPGTRTALNLPNLIPHQDIRRGDVVTLAEFGGPSEILDVVVNILPRAKRPVTQGARVRMHHGSGDVPARVTFFTSKTLAPGGRALAHLRLEEPAFLFAGDRFVLRDWAEQNTLAGGIVLDERAGSAMLHSEARANFLNQRAAAPEDALAYILSQLKRDGAVNQSQLLLQSRFSANEISETLSRFSAEGAVALAGDLVADIAKWKTLRGSAIDSIDAQHRSRPEDAGILLTDLRARLEADLPFTELFDALVEDLCEGEFAQVGASIRRAAHRPALPTQLQAAASKLRAELNANPFGLPSRNQLAPDPDSRQALHFLIKSGEAIEINQEVVMATEHLKRATERVREFIRAHGPSTVSDLRQMLGATRRVIVPLLERLDREGVTLRQGDTRVLRR